MSLSRPLPPAVQAKSGEDVSTEKEREQKRARDAPLHETHSAPLSFLRDALKAAQSDHSFNLTEIGQPFGLSQEAYARQCYEDVVQRIGGVLDTNTENKPHMFVLRGSSGVGKSTFLAYALVRLRAYFKGQKVILCHAEKSSWRDRIICEVWENGSDIFSGLFRDVEVEKALNSHVPSTGLVVMDGCSLPLRLPGFRGTILMAGSPSLFIKNLEDSINIGRRKYYTIPALSQDEAFGIGDLIGVDRAVVEVNFEHIGGIPRYLFEPDDAKNKVKEAVEQVDATSITKMVSMQVWSKATEALMVHSLVLWKVNDYEDTPEFELVSRYAERLVAIKLLKETTEALKRTRMAPLSGAEGYAGALFETYAIRTLQAGGRFSVRNLANNTTTSLTVPPLGEPVVIETNKVTARVAPASQVRVEDGQGGFKACLLWPTTTNFPTFDCFYFHVDGTVYALQMTIARVNDLKNSGADNAKKYFDQILGRSKTKIYPAVFVVPADKEPGYVAQKFQGGVKDMSSCFNQFVIGL